MMEVDVSPVLSPAEKQIVNRQRYAKARETAAKRAYIEWKLVYDGQWGQVYHLRTHGIMRYDRVQNSKSIYEVFVKKDRVSLVTIEKNVRKLVTFKFKNGKMYGYFTEMVDRRKRRSVGLSAGNLEQKVRDFINDSSLLTRKAKYVYLPLLENLKCDIAKKIQEVAAKNGINYDPTKSFVNNYLAISKPNFAFTWTRDIENCQFLNEVVKLFKSEPRKTVKYICGSNTKKVTRLFYTSAQKDEWVLFASKCLLSHLVRRFWSVDYMQKLWSQKGIMVVSPDADYFRNLATYRKILSRMQPATLLHYFEMHRGGISGWRNITDTVRMYIQTNGEYTLPERIRSIPQLHDQLVPAHARYKNKNFKLKCPKRVEKIDGLRFGDYEIRAPKSRNEMNQWGDELHNCIGSYAERVMRGNSIILGVLEKDIIKYGLELNRSLELVQFLGKYNQPPPAEEKFEILSKIDEVVKIEYNGPNEEVEEEADLTLV